MLCETKRLTALLGALLLSLASTYAISSPKCKFVGMQPTEREQADADEIVWNMVFLAADAGMAFGGDSSEWECSSSSLTYNQMVTDGAGNILVLNFDTRIMAHTPAGRYGHVMCLDIVSKRRFTPGANGKCFIARDPFKGFNAR